MTDCNPTCPKCPGTMEEGFIPDATYGGNVLMQWFAGVPGKGFFGGLKLTQKKHHPISTDRCASCGYLEFYARG
jgi:hypothetical protein